MSLLKAFCTERGIRYDECGKLVIATDESEIARFEALEGRARANGVPGLKRLVRPAATIEPRATGIAALHSPATAIVDFAEVARAIADDARAAGATIRTETEVGHVLGRGRTARIELADGTVIEADRAIVCAGLHADRLARASNQPAEPRIVPFRGEYWQLRPERRHLVRGLIYPVPDPALPFLGIHLTRKVDGSVLIGPDAILGVRARGLQAHGVRSAGRPRRARVARRAAALPPLLAGRDRRDPPHPCPSAHSSKRRGGTYRSWRRATRSGPGPASGPRQSIATAPSSTTSASAPTDRSCGCATLPPRRRLVTRNRRGARRASRTRPGGGVAGGCGAVTDPSERVSSAEREDAVTQLREHLLAGRLTLEDFSERVELAYGAQIGSELARASESLPATGNLPAVRSRRKPTRVTAAFFGHVARRGKLRLRRRTFAGGAFSDVDLDLRDAQLDTSEASVNVLIAFGNVDVYVPEGINVSVGGLALFGHRRDWGRELDRPDAPVVHVRALSLFGTVDVWRVPADMKGGYGEIFRQLQDRQRQLPE